MELQIWRFADNVWDVCIPGYHVGGELLTSGTLPCIKEYVVHNMFNLSTEGSGIQKISDGEVGEVGNEDVYLLIDMNNNNTLTRIMKNPPGQTSIKRKFWKGSLLEVIQALEAYIKSLEQ